MSVTNLSVLSPRFIRPYHDPTYARLVSYWTLTTLALTPAVFHFSCVADDRYIVLVVEVSQEISLSGIPRQSRDLYGALSSARTAPHGLYAMVLEFFGDEST